MCVGVKSQALLTKWAFRSSIESESSKNKKRSNNQKANSKKYRSNYLTGSESGQS